MKALTINVKIQIDFSGSDRNIKTFLEDYMKEVEEILDDRLESNAPVIEADFEDIKIDEIEE